MNVQISGAAECAFLPILPNLAQWCIAIRAVSAVLPRSSGVMVCKVHIRRQKADGMAEDLTAMAKIEKLFDSITGDDPIGSFLFWRVDEKNKEPLNSYASSLKKRSTIQKQV